MASSLARKELQRIARTEDFDFFWHFVVDAIYRERRTTQAKQLKAILGTRYPDANGHTFTKSLFNIYRSLKTA